MVPGAPKTPVKRKAGRSNPTAIALEYEDEAIQLDAPRSAVPRQADEQPGPSPNPPESFTKYTFLSDLQHNPNRPLNPSNSLF